MCEGVDVLDGGVWPPSQRGARLGAQDEVLARAGASSPGDEALNKFRPAALPGARGGAQADRVADDVGRGDEALLFQTVDAAISAVCWRR